MGKLLLSGSHVELPLKFLNHSALESIEEHQRILSGPEQDVLAVWRKLHALYFFCLVLNRKSLEWLCLVVICVKKVNHLVKRLKLINCYRCGVWSNKEAC